MDYLAEPQKKIKAALLSGIRPRRTERPFKNRMGSGITEVCLDAPNH